MHRIITTTLAALVLGGACVGLGATSASAATVEAPKFFGIQTSDGLGYPTGSGSVVLPSGVAATVTVLAVDRGVVTVSDEDGRVLCQDEGRSNPYSCEIPAGALSAGPHELHAQVRLGGSSGAVGTSSGLHVDVRDGATDGLPVPPPGGTTDPVTGAGTGAPTPGAVRAIDPVTGVETGADGGAGGGTGVGHRPTVVQGERVGQQIGVVVTLPAGVTSTVRVLDARGQSVVDEQVVGTGRPTTYMLDAPFGKTRSYVVSVVAGADRVQQQFTFAFGGPRI